MFSFSRAALSRFNKSRLSKLAVAGLAIGAAAAAYGFFRQNGHDNAQASAAAPQVPVTAGTATKKDVPVLVRGLGTVQAFKTVTIKARVDGQIVKVDFKEGQDVTAGTQLFQIDPRALPGDARFGDRCQEAQRSAAAGRRARSRAVRQARRLGFPVPPEL